MDSVLVDRLINKALIGRICMKIYESNRKLRRGWLPSQN